MFTFTFTHKVLVLCVITPGVPAFCTDFVKFSTNLLVAFVGRYQVLRHEVLIHLTIVKYEALIVVTIIIIITVIEKLTISGEVMMNQMVIKLTKKSYWRLHKEMPLKWPKFELLCFFQSKYFTVLTSFNERVD